MGIGSIILRIINKIEQIQHELTDIRILQMIIMIQHDIVENHIVSGNGDLLGDMRIKIILLCQKIIEGYLLARILSSQMKSINV